MIKYAISTKKGQKQLILPESIQNINKSQILHLEQKDLNKDIETIKKSILIDYETFKIDKLQNGLKIEEIDQLWEIIEYNRSKKR